ncbi:hypothetical protein DDB_G0276839 [Dictyostelium discoideum AX4]|uniref:FAD/NAD(P)-binding domain-containing protein n=1 Tax=Dictyostelium discoideum TaxID=44689 RepID=Q86L27_DICDI|nr:hypothetical protein DDB_G0276839 [Dictyostelium discoideum AX4]EAL68921.1 hypothetical protein DDB_G0276839 [Dictyostelium discoideum AX4]|eukprot:XP_642930.1 hypothetical protein DDB_G0276839 [Dictyostelium discoideum AX4]
MISDISKNKKWTVIGGGACGIAVIGKLLDNGINVNDLLWIDPEFNVGDIGKKWRTVSSNTTVALFTKFLNACKSFDYENCQIDFNLNHLIPADTCKLSEIADPLQWVTNTLIQDKKVPIIKGLVNQVSKINENNNNWSVSIKSSNNDDDDDDNKIINIISENVVLTIGAEPLTILNESKQQQQQQQQKELITVEQVVNPEELKKVCKKDDVVAVYGSSHTAIIALYNIVDIGSKIINFYRSPLKYAEYYDDWILYDNTGLKGYSAEWAKEHLEKNPTNLIERIQVDNKELLENKLSNCTKVVYAIGFERRGSVNIKLNENQDWINSSNLKYNESNGIISNHGLFGIGIAFPQFKPDRVGNLEYNVGLWKFMVYLDQVLPLWLNKNKN